MELAKGILFIFNQSLSKLSSAISSRLNETDGMQGIKKESSDSLSANYDTSSMNYAK